MAGQERPGMAQRARGFAHAVIDLQVIYQMRPIPG
jgi:hypothetical protein